MTKAETHALSSGCNKAHVKTFSFQAKPFYEKVKLSSHWGVKGLSPRFQFVLVKEGTGLIVKNQVFVERLNGYIEGKNSFFTFVAFQNFFLINQFMMITQKLKILSIFTCLLLGSVYLNAQIDARMLQNPDVSQTHITFVYAGDIWVVPKAGGLASKLSSPQGQESFPRFSPDGSQIAFSGNYDGNQDVYVIPSMGGIPQRVTHHGMGDRVLDWTPGGDKILFASSRESGRQRYNQFYTASPKGGLPTKLPVPYGEFACYSPDGTKVAFTPATRSFRTWKRYRGGTAQDITIFNLSDYSTEKITKNNANDELPMWHGNKIYFPIGIRAKINVSIFGLMI